MKISDELLTLSNVHKSALERIIIYPERLVFNPQHLILITQYFASVWHELSFSFAIAFIARCILSFNMKHRNLNSDQDW